MNLNTISLDKEIILNTTEGVIRRFGPDKANITDVAKVLKVSHAAIYRYYDGKADLWNAVTERWLMQIHAPLSLILNEDSPADIKLCHWLEVMMEAKRLSSINDPEIFANYIKLSNNSMGVLENHLNDLVNQLEKIIMQGITEGIFFSKSSSQSAKAVFLATRSFNYPKSFEDPDRKQNMEFIVNLILSALKNSNN